MSEQVMTMRGVPLTIATAHGVIELHRVEGDRRKLKIVLPPGLSARVGTEAVKKSPWLDIVDGDVVPKHRVLEADYDGEGFKGLRPARPLRVT